MSRVYEASQRSLEPTETAPVSPVSPPAVEAMHLFPPEDRSGEQVSPQPRNGRVPSAVALSRDPDRSRTIVTRSAPGVARSQATDKLITNSARTAAFAQYRRLAATLVQPNPGRGLTMVITSAVPGEGKTLSAANLALTLTEAFARRVLLVEADMRRPVLSELFGIHTVLGFCDCLRAGRVLPAATVGIHGGLTLLPAGQPDKDPVGLLSSDRLGAFVEEAARQFDCVLFDTPPAVLLPDAELLSRVVDTTVLVVRAGKTAYQQVGRAVDAIGRERIAGVLLNQVQSDTASDKEYHDYYTPYVDSTKV